MDQAAHAEQGQGGEAQINMGVILQQVTAGMQAMAASKRPARREDGRPQERPGPRPATGVVPSTAGDSIHGRPTGGGPGTAQGRRCSRGSARASTARPQAGRYQHRGHRSKRKAGR